MAFNTEAHKKGNLTNQPRGGSGWEVWATVSEQYQFVNEMLSLQGVVTCLDKYMFRNFSHFLRMVVVERQYISLFPKNRLDKFDKVT